MTIYCFDLDGTLCNTDGSDYEASTPKAHRIVLVNRLYNQGHYVKIFTARGGTSGRDWTELTRSQLQEWGVLHHELILGKPAADIYVDDKASSDLTFFSQTDSEQELSN